MNFITYSRYNIRDWTGISVPFQPLIDLRFIGAKPTMSDFTPKQCAACSEFFPATAEYFHRNKTKVDGLNATCKVCASAYSAAYNAAHKEEKAANDRAYRIAHKEEIAVYQTVYRVVNEAKITARRIAYYAAHKEEIAIKSADRYVANKEKVSAKHAAYYRANSDAVKTRTKEYRDSHPDEVKTAHKAWWDTNREDQLARNKARYAARDESRQKRDAQKRSDWAKSNPEKARGIKAAWRDRNREQHNASNRAYNAAHPDIGRAFRRKHKNANREMYRNKDRKRRALKALLPYTLTVEDNRRANEYFGGVCPCCGNQTQSLFAPMHLDHWVPLSKGGGTTPDNMVPLCSRCNLSKSNIMPHEWLVRTFGKRQATIILDRIEAYFASLHHINGGGQ